jgi:hypothetical protein
LDTYIEVFQEEEKNSFLEGTFSIFLTRKYQPAIKRLKITENVFGILV